MTGMWQLGVIVVVVMVLLAPATAHAERRIALVVGNGQYAHEAPLDNPANDAREVGAALRRVKFDDVEIVLNADLITMQSALARFARKADTADVALIYYSGHGIEIDGRNYLIPVNAKLIDAGDADFETVPLDQAMLAADRAGKVKIVVLDACRNNPFRVRVARKQGKRSVGRGLAAVSVASGMLVAYAARAGSEAADGPPGGNSPFTAAFLKFIESPRVDVRLMLGRVRDEVVRATGRQEPFTYGSLGGDEVYLNSYTAGGVPNPRKTEDTQSSAAALEWSRVDKSSLPELETFRRRHPSSSEAEYAQARIQALSEKADPKLREKADLTVPGQLPPTIPSLPVAIVPAPPCVEISPVQNDSFSVINQRAAATPSWR